VGWLDLRALDEARLGELAADVAQHANERAARDGTALRVDVESLSPAVRFDQALRDRLATTLGGVPVLDTQAGHDAGVLATEMPTGMLFVRNPSGVSHSPAEHAERADCLAGVEALARVVAAEAGA